MKDSEYIPGWLSKNEGKLLQRLAGSLPENAVVVEVGSFQGKSTTYLAKGLKDGKIYAIDPHLGETLIGARRLPPTYRTFINNTKQYKNIIPIRKTSAEANKNWKLSIDLLHIDALHEYEFVKKDLKMWLPHLKSRGIVICHDAFTSFPEVWMAVKEEILDKKGWGYVGVLDSQFFAIKGRPQLNWQRQFIILASELWHISWMPENLRFFIVNRLLKLFFLNKYMFLGMFDRL